jgi:hypothetical protein
VSWETDQATTGVVAYGTSTAYELGTVSTTASANAHSVTLPNLQPGTRHHFKITARNGAALESASNDRTFQTAQHGTQGFLADTFEGSTLDPDIWTFVDPLGDGTVSVSDGHAHISVPAGTSHNIWSTGNDAPRIVQAFAGQDFELEARFTSVLSSRFQMQGLVIEETPGRFLRFEFYHDGSGVRAFAAVIDGTSATVRADVAITGATGPTHIRVAREGNTWRHRYSVNGTTWQTAATFSFALAPTRAGVYAGNYGSPAPAHTTSVDYVLDRATAAPPGPGTPLAISALRFQPTGPSTGRIRWTTNQPASSRADYGVTTTFGAHRASDALVTDHALDVTHLTCQTQYRLHATSRTASDETTTSAGTFVAGDCPNPGVGQPPHIDVWDGDVQTFGDRGRSQQWINVRGSVGSFHGINALSFRLNGGPSRALGRGPDLRRLATPGDFNVELAYEELGIGANSIVIAARDVDGRESTRTVTVHRVHGPAPTLPWATHWASASGLGDHGYPVDGPWAVAGGAASPVALEYDRLFVVGDVTWTDYEVTVPITVKSLGPNAYTSQSGTQAGHMVGLGVRWLGHTPMGSGNHQPNRYWYPTGAFAWYLFGTGRFELVGNNDTPIRRVAAPYQLGVPYVYKVRVETISSTRTRYRFKVWRQSEPEPSSWPMDIVVDGGPSAGAVTLLAHHAEAHFGDVVVEPLQ